VRGRTGRAGAGLWTRNASTNFDLWPLFLDRLSERACVAMRLFTQRELLQPTDRPTRFSQPSPHPSHLWHVPPRDAPAVKRRPHIAACFSLRTRLSKNRPIAIHRHPSPSIPHTHPTHPSHTPIPHTHPSHTHTPHTHHDHNRTPTNPLVTPATLVAPTGKSRPGFTTFLPNPNIPSLYYFLLPQ
jgi:hypothetical protein